MNERFARVFEGLLGAALVITLLTGLWQCYGAWLLEERVHVP